MLIEIYIHHLCEYLLLWIRELSTWPGGRSSLIAGHAPKVVVARGNWVRSMATARDNGKFGGEDIG